MFVSLFLAAAAQVLPIVIPFGKPQPLEKPRAPIETSGPLFASQCTDSDDYAKPAPPVRIFGNTYIVGTCGITSILITDPAGDILIDGGPEEAADLIVANVRKLGFQPTDIRYILHSHEHYDHVGGIAKLQRLTGAQLIASPAAAAVLNSGTPAKDDPQAGILKPFPAAHVDRVVQDGEMVRLGNNVLTATATPGHTAGALTWRWGSCQGGVCRQIVYADSLTPVSAPSYRFSDHPAWVAGLSREHRQGRRARLRHSAHPASLGEPHDRPSRAWKNSGEPKFLPRLCCRADQAARRAPREGK